MRESDKQIDKSLQVLKKLIDVSAATPADRHQSTMSTPKKSRNMAGDLSTPKRTVPGERPAVSEFANYLGGIHAEFKRG